MVCADGLGVRDSTKRRIVLQTETKKLDTEALWAEFTQTPTPRLREQLVLAYLGLVKYVSGRLAIGLPTFVELEDLFGAGLLGLMQAVDKFDPTRNIKFETYAVPRIRGAMLDELRTQDWFPRSVRRKAKSLEQAYVEVESKLERSASDEDVARHLGLRMDEYYTLVDEVCVTTLVSLDKEVANSNEGLYAVISDTIRTNNPDPSQMLEEKQLRALVRVTIDEMPDKERTVLTLYYYEELTLKEIGDVLGISESRVCQIHTKAVVRLRGRINQLTRSRSVKQLSSKLQRSRDADSSATDAPSQPAVSNPRT